MLRRIASSLARSTRNYAKGKFLNMKFSHTKSEKNPKSLELKCLNNISAAQFEHKLYNSSSNIINISKLLKVTEPAPAFAGQAVVNGAFQEISLDGYMKEVNEHFLIFENYFN